jgi:hypothetical protein
MAINKLAARKIIKYDIKKNEYEYYSSTLFGNKCEDFISEEVLNGNLVEGVNYVLMSEDNVVKFKTSKKQKKEGK